MTEHTHILTRRHSIVDKDGNRVKLAAGDPVSPTEDQLKNMPDTFLTRDGAAVDEVPSAHGMKGMSITTVKDTVAEITDFDVLEAMMSEEEANRDRKGAKTAIAARIEFLTAAAEEAADE